jgi:predicted Rossmann fold nucleotide-binding protein DprA/Smf involved in DNA uptake
LRGSLQDTLTGWSDKTVTQDRIAKLLDRGSALAIAMEKWQRSGLWVLARSDSAYPQRFKKRLKTASPPVLFGCGNAKLLNQGGLAVVGSRKVSTEDLKYAENLGSAAASAGVSVVSGGAKGIDEAAMLGALTSQGTVIGVLADGLLRACSSQKYRSYLTQNDLVLISTYHPEAGFNAGNAMGRNKYVYCLSDAAVVVHAGLKGGTWAGAAENLKKSWVPVWVKITQDKSSGNANIVKQGGSWVAEDVSKIDVKALINTSEYPQQTSAPSDLFSTAVHELDDSASKYSDFDSKSPIGYETQNSETEESVRGECPDLGFYDLFLMKLREVCKDEALAPDDLADRLGLQKSQLVEWLKQAVAEGKIRKLTRPVRYQWNASHAQQSMF